MKWREFFEKTPIRCRDGALHEVFIKLENKKIGDEYSYDLRDIIAEDIERLEIQSGYYNAILLRELMDISSGFDGGMDELIEYNQQQTALYTLQKIDPEQDMRAMGHVQRAEMQRHLEVLFELYSKKANTTQDKAENLTNPQDMDKYAEGYISFFKKLKSNMERVSRGMNPEVTKQPAGKTDESDYENRKYVLGLEAATEVSATNFGLSAAYSNCAKVIERIAKEIGVKLQPTFLRRSSED